MAPTTTLFALLGTDYGSTVTLAGTPTGDVAYAWGILAVLLVVLGLLPISQEGDNSRRHLEPSRNAHVQP